MTGKLSRPLAFSCVLMAFALALAGTGPAAGQERWGPGNAPGATLLIPYFRVDLNGTDGPTTLVAIGNVAAEPTVAHVVLWSDFGLPTLAFNVFLDGNDVQTLNLRDVFAGELPSTGGPGPAGCDPVALPAVDRQLLIAQHTGRPSPTDGLCYGSGRAGEGMAVGYMTVDVVRDCRETPSFPGEEGYFGTGDGSFVAFDNVLWGDYFYLSSRDDSAQGLEAVQIRADPALSQQEAGTFYLPYSAGLDLRAAMPSRHRARYLFGGSNAGGTQLVLWNQPNEGEAFARECGSVLSDFCLPFLDVGVFDESGRRLDEFRVEITERAAALTVGGPELPVEAEAGYFDVSVEQISACILIPTPPRDVPSWISPIWSAFGRFSIGLHAVPLN